MTGPGLRELKKQRTRQAIASAASALFAERGFEEVTVAEVARAAGVATGTVFNYFPAKEDLFFDRDTALLGQLASTLRDRPPGQSIAAAFRRWHDTVLTGLLAPGAAPHLARFFRILADSPALQAHADRLDRRYRQAVESAARQCAPGPGDPVPGLLAAQLVTVHRSVMTAVQDTCLHEPDAAAWPQRAAAVTEQAFSLLSTTAHHWGQQAGGAGDGRGAFGDDGV